MIAKTYFTFPILNQSLIDCNYHVFVGKTLSNVNSSPRPEHDVLLHAITSPSIHHYPRPEHDVPPTFNF